MNDNRDWIKRRLDFLNEDQINYFIEHVGVMMNNGMDRSSARPAALILLIEYLRR